MRKSRRVLAFDTARSFLQVLTAQRVVEAATRRLQRSLFARAQRSPTTD